MFRILALLLGYCFGLFQTSYIYGRMHGIDIRKMGSGNAGTTNALRTLGKKAGAIVLIGDLLKCIAGVLLIPMILTRFYPEAEFLLPYYAGLGCILGHNFPFYMGFKGGKGVACTAGLVIATSLPYTLIGIVIFFGTVAWTHYVSLASLTAGSLFLVYCIIAGQCGLLGTTDPAVLLELYAVIAVIIGLMFFQHRANIARLLKKEERKTYIFKKN